MAQVERIRSFIAIDIGPEVRAALCARTRELARAGADARWVRPEGMHATLKFLGGVEPKRLQAVREAVEFVVADTAAMSMSVCGLGAFPTLRRPRVLWAGIQCPGLSELVVAMDSVLSPLEFEPEGRSFHPHITVARVRSLGGWTALAAAFERYKDEDFGHVDVTAITIYRSTLRPDILSVSKAATVAYQTNQAGLLNVLDTQTMSIDIEYALFEALSEYERSLADLERSIGIPLLGERKPL